MKKNERRVKLLIARVNREDETRLTEIVNELTTAVHFSGLGH